MNSKLCSIVIASLLFSGCGGSVGGCPAIFIPIYEVNVYDIATGELICSEGLSSNPNLENCEISFDYSEDGEAADITVNLQGYTTETLNMVENQTWRSGCWDSPEYTTSVDIYLTPE